MEGKNTLFEILKASKQSYKPDIKEKQRERLTWVLTED